MYNTEHNWCNTHGELITVVRRTCNSQGDGWIGLGVGTTGFGTGRALWAWFSRHGWAMVFGTTVRRCGSGEGCNVAMVELGLGGSRLSMAIANGCNWGLNWEMKSEYGVSHNWHVTTG